MTAPDPTRELTEKLRAAAALFAASPGNVLPASVTISGRRAAEFAEAITTLLSEKEALEKELAEARKASANSLLASTSTASSLATLPYVAAQDAARELAGLEEAAQAGKLAVLQAAKKTRRTERLRLGRALYPHEVGDEVVAAIRALISEDGK